MTDKNQIKKNTGKLSRPPKFVVTPEIIAEIERLAFGGLKQKHIHDYFGISHDLWHRVKNAHPEIEKALSSGRAKGIDVATLELMKHVQKGNLKAIIFYLKARAGFNDVDLNSEFAADDPQQRPMLTLTVNDPVEASRIYQKLMTET
jgi:hypothetical protein